MEALSAWNKAALVWRNQLRHNPQILVAMIFITTLYITLHKLLGLKSFMNILKILKDLLNQANYKRHYPLPLTLEEQVFRPSSPRDFKALAEKLPWSLKELYIKVLVTK